MKSLYRLVVITCLILPLNGIYIPPGPQYPCPTMPDQIQLLHPCLCERGSDFGLYVLCENAGIATLSVGLGNIASLNLPIERLRINECNIKRLYGSLLHKLRVRILEIVNTPIKKIEPETFYGINQTLQHFYLLNSELDLFPTEAFKILGNLTHLYLDNNNLKRLDKNIFSESLSIGTLERLHLTNGQLEELQIESLQPLRKLKTLDLHGNYLSILKKNQFKGLREVEVLDISFNNISKLESSHIADLTKLTWCNVSHNYLTEMSRGMFARNPVLKVLHMNSNKLKRLDTNSFRGMRFLRRLFLSENEISDVGRGTFSSITRVGTIDLARNKIKKIDYQMFYKLNFIELIDVSNNLVTEIQKSSFTDLYLTTINISYNIISKIEAGSFENCANITLLDLSHNNLSDIPIKAFDSTTYATELQLSYNNFSSLNQIPLHNMTGLKILNVSHNVIESIPKNTFPKLYELHTVDVSYNQLKDIFSSVFQTLFSLRYLNLSHNSMEQIKPATFGTLPTILELNLSHNYLRDVSRGSLTKLASCSKLDMSHNLLEKIFTMPISLGDLNLSNNNISSIPANTWPSMNALLKLDLSNNPLNDNLSSDSFRNLLTLQTLILTATSLTKPPWEALSSLTSLQYLKLNKNNLTSLNKGAFGRLPIVFDLDLSENQIMNISKRAFDGLLQLLKLSLNNNNLHHIPNEAFYGLVSMRSLDLSQNSLEKLDNRTNGLLDDCLSLENVNLSYNKISFITRKTFPNDPYIPYNLKNIDLSHNDMPVITGDILFGTRKLEVLNISYNMLNDIRNGVIGNLSALKILDLSHNNLKDLTSERIKFRLPVNIKILNLSHNQLVKLPIDHIKNASNLKMLNVSNNLLQYFDSKLVTKIKKNGTNIDFSGNPIHCDCFLRPLKHYLNHLIKSKQMNDTLYSNILCSAPPSVENFKLIDIDDDRLNCIQNIAINKKIEMNIDKDLDDSNYHKETDLVFRDIQFSQSNIQVSWYIQTSKDIADFQIIIRNSKNNIFYIKILPYSDREIIINLNEVQKLKTAIDAKSNDLELCILSGSSNSESFNWFQSQCRMLPSDFILLPKHLNLKKRNRKMLLNRSASRKNGTLVIILIFEFILILIYNHKEF